MNRPFVALALLLATVSLSLAQTDVAVHGYVHSVKGISIGSGAVGGADGEVIDSAGAYRGPVPAAETIAAAGTITADGCGTVKRVTAAGAVTTGTTNTFTAPATSNEGCIMQVCNSGSNAITLDDNALFEASGIGGATPGDTVLGAADCVPVGSDGAVWRQLAPGSQN